jgi:hypothetical protein
MDNDRHLYLKTEVIELKWQPGRKNVAVFNDSVLSVYLLIIPLLLKMFYNQAGGKGF